MAASPSINDSEFDLLKKLVINTAALATQNVGNLESGGSSILITSASTFADLPAATAVAPINSIYLVLSSTGIWPISDHSAGFYIRRGVTGTGADWEKL